jgi:hypothetical protein
MCSSFAPTNTSYLYKALLPVLTRIGDETGLLNGVTNK